MQEKICLKRTGNTGHFMESERNLHEYSNSFRHHTSGICTTGSECLRSGLSHHWIKLNRQYHIEPSKMKEDILQTLSSLPSDVDTVLVAMGFCGGSWQDVFCSKTLVIPRVADCVALTLTTPEQYAPNPKEPGHMYLFGN